MVTTVTVQEQGAYGYRYGCPITRFQSDTKQMLLALGRSCDGDNYMLAL
jgi:hypothetical protein